MANKKSIGLKGGPNEFLQDITQYISVDGYKRYSEDVSNPYNVIESGNITMKDVDFPVLGTDNLGNSQMMMPEIDGVYNEYQFPGNQVTELPMGGLGGPIKSIIQAAVKKFPAIQKAIGKNYDEAVEYFSSNIDEFKNYLRSYTDEAESILPGPATTEISPTLRLPFNQRGQIIPQQHMTSGNHSTNAGDALDHIYGDGPMWFAPTGDTRYINTSTNLPFVSGSGKPIQRSYTDFIGNTGKQGFDEFPLTEKEKLTKSFGGYYGKIVDGEYVADLDNPIMRSQLRVVDGMQNKIEGVFDPNIKIKIIDGKPSKLGHSLEGNWDGTKIGQFQDEGYDVIQVINEFTGDQLENILLPNSKHKFKVTKIDDMPVQIDNPEFKYGGRFMQDAGEIEEENIQTVQLPEVTIQGNKKEKGFDWKKLLNNTLNPLYYADNALQLLGTPANLIREGIEGISGKGDGKFDWGNIVPDVYGTTIFDDDAKQKSVSQTLGVDNFWGGLALDMLTDPTTYIGAGIVKNLVKTGGKTVVPKVVKNLTTRGAKSTDDIVKQADNFTSEINWGKWNKDIPKNKGLVDEYTEIEKLAKADGTWMKNADGSAFTLPDGSLGTVEQFVQTNSKNFKKSYPKGIDVTYRGADQHIPDGMRGNTSGIYNNDYVRPEVGDGLFTGNKKLAADYAPGNNIDGLDNGAFPYFTSSQKTLDEIIEEGVGLTRNSRGQITNTIGPADPGGIYKLAIPTVDDATSVTFNANKRDWTNLDNQRIWDMMPKDVQEAAARARSKSGGNSVMFDPKNPGTSFGGYATDDVATMMERLGLNRAQINNVYDFGVGDVLIHNNKKGNFAKSLFGNDGTFNLMDRNIYRAGIPLTIGGYGLGQQQVGPGTDNGKEVTSWKDIKLNVEGLMKGLRRVESADGTLMINPYSTATGSYGQRFSEIEDLYDGTRDEFSKDLEAQDKFFRMRLNEGIESNETTPLLRDAFDLTEEYRDQLGDKWNYSYEDVAALSNYLGRGGTRRYLGDVIRDGKSLAEVFPNLFGEGAKQPNKKPAEYLKITNEFYQDGGENIYRVKRGDNLSKIARNYNTSVDEIVSMNDISNPSMISIDQDLLMPKGSSLQSENKTYTVKSGDTLGKIAKRYGTSYRRLADINNISDPNMIRIDQDIILPKEYREEVPLAQESWISTDTLKKNNDDINALADEQVIVKSQLLNDPNGRYVVVDKKNGRLKLYHGDEIITDFEILTGGQEGDAQTVTQPIDKNRDGKITEEDKINGIYQVDWSKGNLSTGAGRFQISNSSPTSSNKYMNAPSFNLVNEAGIEISTAIHGAPSYRQKYFNNNDITDNRSSNGCINGKCSDLQGLYDMGLPNGTNVFILPDDEGNSFEMVDGQAVMRMSRDNRERYQQYERNDATYKGQGGNYTTETLNYKPIRAQFDIENFKENVFTALDFNDDTELYETTIPFINALMDNKKEIMQATKIPGDVYNQIAKIAFGIYGTESNFGDTHSATGNFSRAVNKYMNPGQSSSPDVLSKYNTYGQDNDSNSVGYTQIRFSFLNDTERKALEQFDIYDNSDMLDPEKSAIATAVVLGVRYNEQLTPSQKKNPMRYLPTKWNNRDNYGARVKKNSRYLGIEQFDKMKTGGELEQNIMYKNYVDGVYENTKMSSVGEKAYDKLNRKYLKQAKELGMTPSNYVMTHVISDS